ncbi:SMP-30/gluconolactonase/LRE family protein [Rhodobacteraceae bacterium]|nr:SMP-30/gluconolactonase/LRE family protein [Paracoccaceae bacterium]
MMAQLFDARICELGEGAFWHPTRQQLFWVDIIGKRLLGRHGDTALEWQFDECLSALGWLDYDHLIVATETALWKFQIDSGARTKLVELEADCPENRSNDGRADPMGGFWVGTMGKHKHVQGGGIWRYYKGTLRKIVSGLDIPNSICFSPDATVAYWSDTSQQKLWAQPLDADGWPHGAPSLFLDLTSEGLYPDGAVTDETGAIWIAQWGASRVARYLPNGAFDYAITIGATQASCPVFGGAELRDLFVTTAHEHMDAPDAHQGTLWHHRCDVKGLPAPRVLL